MNQNVLATAVASALAAGFAASTASGNGFPEQLFPYVVKDANRPTVVTLIADGSGAFPTSAGASVLQNGLSEVHLQYWTKSTTDANTAACQPSSVFVPMTENDILTLDTAGLLGYPLFGDTTNPAPLGTAISYPGPRHGYLVAIGINASNLHAGYRLELDLANGGARGDYSLHGSGESFLSFGFDAWGVYGASGKFLTNATRIVGNDGAVSSLAQ